MKAWGPRAVTSRTFYEKLEVFTPHPLSLEGGWGDGNARLNLSVGSGQLPFPTPGAFSLLQGPGDSEAPA